MKSKLLMPMQTVGVLATATLVLALTGCGSSGTNSAGSNGVVQWDYLVFTGASDPHTTQAQKFAQDVATATNGKLKITVRTPGELPYQLPQFLETIASGRVAMADAFSNGVSGELPVAGVLGLPFLTTSYDQLNEGMKAVMPHLKQGLAKYHATLAFWYAYPPQNLWGSGSPVTSLDGVRGLKIRSQGKSQTLMLEKMGAIPVTLNSSEVADAWQRGVISTNITSAAAVVGSGWTSFVKWGYELNTSVPPNYVVVNTQVLDSLPAATKSAFDRVAAKYQKLWQTFAPQSEAQAQASLKHQGVTITPASARNIESLRQQAKSTWGSYVGSDQFSKEALAAAEKAIK